MVSSTCQSEGKFVLITGGAGFIGSHLCKKFLENGWGVVAVDNLSTGFSSNIERYVKEYSKFYFLNEDITRRDLELRVNVKFDVLVNLACPASPPKYMARPFETIACNVAGILNIEKFATRIVHASTSEIYGDPVEHPQTEKYWGNVNSFGSRSCYDEGKRIAETILYELAKKGKDVRIARIFNTYGPMMDINDGRVVTNFIRQALNGEPLTIYGDGKQTRSLCYVDDTVNALYALAIHPANGIFNVGNPVEMTVKEIANKISNILGVPKKYDYKDLPMDDPKQRRPDISKIQETIGWIPSTNVDDGLLKTIEYFQEKMNANRNNTSVLCESEAIRD